MAHLKKTFVTLTLSLSLSLTHTHTQSLSLRVITYLLLLFFCSLATCILKILPKKTVSHSLPNDAVINFDVYK